MKVIAPIIKTIVMAVDMLGCFIIIHTYIAMTIPIGNNDLFGEFTSNPFFDNIAETKIIPATFAISPGIMVIPRFIHLLALFMVIPNGVNTNAKSPMLTNIINFEYLL